MRSPNALIPSNFPTYTVLVVESRSADWELYRRYLLADTSCRYTLLEANSVNDAILSCQHHQIDAILVGYTLPDVNGLNFLQSLQTQFDGKSPPVVIVASENDAAVPSEVAVQRAVRAIKLGAENYLVKSTLTTEQLQLAIQDAIKNARSHLQSPQQEEVSRLRQLNQELTDRVAELQTLIEILPIGIAIASDPSCAQMHCNALMREMLGVNAKQNISKSAPAGEQPTFEVFQNGQEVPSEDLPMQMAARLGVDVLDTEVEIRLSDGTARQLLSYATPLRDEQGEIRGAVGAFLDVTDRKRTEAELRDREEQLQLFIKHVPADVAMFDREMRYLATSDRWLRSYGLEWQDIVGRSHYDIFPDIPDRWKEVHQRCLAGVIETCDEDPFPRADGSIDWVRWEVHPWYTNSHEIGGIIFFSELITERKQAEIRLQESEATIRRQFAELEGIYATAPVGLCFQDADLRYVRINDRLAEINGIPASEHLGRTLHDILPELADTVEPLHRRVVETGEPLLNIEIHGRTKAQPDIERDWIASYYPLKDADGQVLGVNAVVQDITELKQAQAEREQLLGQLELERRFLEQILQQMPSGVAIAEVPTGKLLFHNDEAIRLLRHPMVTLETYSGYTNYGALHSDGQPYQPEEYPIARSVLIGEVVKAEEMPYRRGDGTETIFSVNAAPIVDPSGNRIAAVSTFEDISDRKQIEAERAHLLAQAENANRSKDEFVAMVAHELRSPLNAILGWAKLLQTRSFDSATTQKALETIVRNTQAQVQLVEDLLDVSRMVRGTLQLDFATVDLVEVVEGAIETVRPTAEAKALQLETRLQQTVPIRGDFNRLQQMVLNLLTNAIKFTPEGRQVQVLLDQQDSHIRIQFVDTGKGINPDFLPHIFERFQQDQQSTTAKQGLGLGLAIVQYIVEQHHGTVTAQSKGVGQGATFTVLLPLSQEDEKVQSEGSMSSPVDPTAQPLSGMRVLLVDDEEDMLDLTAFIMEQAGAAVQTANSAAAALEQLLQFQPNLLISDIAMPGQNGCELLQQVRSMGARGQIPAIALTAYTSGTRRENSLRAGFLHHLTKPIEPDELIQVIVNVLHRRECNV
jgi:PAS domain S-box-containing protein